MRDYKDRLIYPNDILILLDMPVYRRYLTRNNRVIERRYQRIPVFYIIR